METRDCAEYKAKQAAASNMAGYAQATEGGSGGSRWFKKASVCAGQCSTPTERNCEVKCVSLATRIWIDSGIRGGRSDSKIEWYRQNIGLIGQTRPRDGCRHAAFLVGHESWTGLCQA
jgi:hypothetical protein